jgi:2-methylcitrate dehydratase PrpD
MLDRLGTEWDILDPGATLKLHACCGASHYCIDALLDLIDEHRFRPDDVASIECHVPSMVPTILVYDEPSTGLEAKFSMAYPIAAALLDGAVGVDQFSSAAVQRPQARQVMQKVRYVHPEASVGNTAEIVEAPHEVVVRLADGSSVRRSCRYFRGRAERPISEAELLAKFDSCASSVLPAPVRAEIVATIGDLDHLDDVAALNRLLAGDR